MRVGVLLVGFALLAGLLVYVRMGEPGAERAGTDRAAIDPAVKKAIDEVVVPYDVENALGLPDIEMPEDLLHGRGKGYKKRRSREQMDADYGADRGRRLALAKRCIKVVAPRLEFTPDQASGLVRASMERGDTVRVAYWRKLLGVNSKSVLQEVRQKAAQEYEVKIEALLTPAQLAEWRRIEESDHDETGEDLGFGSMYGHGGGKERGGESVPD